MATKNNRRILVTKRILRESLLELMQEKPIARISVKEICDLSEMSRSTFYLHYQDPYELLSEIEEEALEKALMALGDIGGMFGSRESVARFLSYLKENKGTFGVLLSQAGDGAFQNRIMDAIEGQVRAAIPEMRDEAHGEYRMAFLMHGSLKVLQKWMQNDFDVPVEGLSELIFQLCTGSV